eukprot:TRINITY_DN2287_c2_g1_i2.p1 TRINITY_DN2287_c2_g1~~TRINITY_DN2287_c2_g1_i2.p1  ORF type:complete len:888 (+),score=188.83 TRINITY_DN2287_c2_g1_i2:269-2932(+)
MTSCKVLNHPSGCSIAHSKQPQQLHNHNGTQQRPPATPTNTKQPLLASANGGSTTKHNSRNPMSGNHKPKHSSKKPKQHPMGPTAGKSGGRSRGGANGNSNNSNNGPNELSRQQRAAARKKYIPMPPHLATSSATQPTNIPPTKLPSHPAPQRQSLIKPRGALNRDSQRALRDLLTQKVYIGAKDEVADNSSFNSGGANCPIGPLSFETTPLELLRRLEAKFIRSGLRLDPTAGVCLVGSGAAVVIDAKPDTAGWRGPVTRPKGINDLDFTIYLSPHFTKGAHSATAVLNTALVCEEEVLSDLLCEQRGRRLSHREVFACFFRDSIKVETPARFVAPPTTSTSATTDQAQDKEDDGPSSGSSTHTKQQQQQPHAVVLGEAWSLCSLAAPGPSGFQIDIKVILRPPERCYAFSLDSFEVVIDPLLHSNCGRGATSLSCLSSSSSSSSSNNLGGGSSPRNSVSTEGPWARSTYGNYKNALAALQQRTLQTDRPGRIRQGIFRYSLELAKGNQPSAQDRTKFDKKFTRAFVREFRFGVTDENDLIVSSRSMNITSNSSAGCTANNQQRPGAGGADTASAAPRTTSKREPSMRRVKSDGLLQQVHNMSTTTTNNTNNNSLVSVPDSTHQQVQQVQQQQDAACALNALREERLFRFEIALDKFLKRHEAHRAGILVQLGELLRGAPPTLYCSSELRMWLLAAITRRISLLNNSNNSSTACSSTTTTLTPPASHASTASAPATPTAQHLTVAEPVVTSPSRQVCVSPLRAVTPPPTAATIPTNSNTTSMTTPTPTTTTPTTSTTLTTPLSPSHSNSNNSTAIIVLPASSFFTPFTSPNASSAAVATSTSAVTTPTPTFPFCVRRNRAPCDVCFLPTHFHRRQHLPSLCTCSPL